MIKELKDYFSPFLIMADLAAVTITYGICARLSVTVCQSIAGIPIPARAAAAALPSDWERNLLFLPFLFFIPIVMFGIDRAFSRIRKEGSSGIFLRVGVAAIFTLAILLLTVTISASVTLRNSACFMALFLFAASLSLFINRLVLRYVLTHDDKKSNCLKYILILGTDEKAVTISQQIGAHPESGLRLAGFISKDNQKSCRHPLAVPVVGSVDSILTTLKNNATDGILYTGDPQYLPYIDTVFRRCQIEGIDFAYVTNRNHMNSSNIYTDKIGDYNILIIKHVFQHPAKLSVKRLFDFIASTALICLLVPFWIAIPILIKRDSTGPVFFRQERVGKNGRRFIMYKFRSMIAQAEKLQPELSHLNEMDGPAFKIKNDPRQTRVGRILRQTSLDELPQLFNVFKGDISLVGPRPPIQTEVALYQPWEKKRLSVVPGITCLWQVSGRNNIKFDEWMKLDLLYIENWTFAFDLKILVKTIPAVISRKGAR